MTEIFVDADACPVKEEIIKVASRYHLQMHMVSGQGVRANALPNVHAVLVGNGFDAADDWIAEHINAKDICITSDIPLAKRCIERGAYILKPSGHLLTEENIGAAFASRELNAYLREAGEIKGYNAGFSKKDRSAFLQALDRLIIKLQRTASKA